MADHYYGGRGGDRDYDHRRHGDHDRGRDRYHGDGGHQFRDRGGGGQGRGRGGRQGGGRGGGRGGPGDRANLERNGLPVQVNLFRLQFNVRATRTWYWYQIQINNVKKIPKKDADGNVIRKDGITQFEYQVGRSLFDDRDLSQHDNEAETTKQERRNRASHLSRRIIAVFQRELGVELINDGSSTAISATEIEGLQKSADDRPKRKKREGSAAGVYGPADTGGSAVAPEQNPIIKPWKVYDPIRVRRDCDDDDPEAHLSSLAWFQIKLTQVGSFTFSVAPDGSIQGANKAPEACCQAINLAVKNAMLGRMLALDRDTRCFYFKESPYTRNSSLNNIPYDDKCMPLYGLLQTATLTASGVCILADLGLGWQRLDKDRNNNPIPVLQHEKGEFKIAGVTVGCPVPERLREEVHRALKKITFHVKYTCPDDWVEEKARKPTTGFDDIDIEGKRKHWKKRARMGKRNQRLFKILRGRESEESNIKWSANDLREFSFDFAFFSSNGEKEETRKVTVAEYFRERYHINLKYPEMPLVRISQQEWFPIEFLFVSHGSAVGGSSEAERKTKFALTFNDTFACQDRIKEISRLIGNDDVYDRLAQKLDLLNLRLDTNPMTLSSKVLKMPRLLAGERQEQEIVMNNGSWNLRDNAFKKAATMHSFAVLNLAGREGESCRDLPDEIFKALDRHGVKLAFIKREDANENPANIAQKAKEFWNHVRVTPRDDASRQPAFLLGAFEDARKKARRCFMTDTLNQNLCFRTLARVEVDQSFEVREVVVFPSKLVSKAGEAELRDQEKFAVIEYEDFQTRPTHEVILPGGTRRLDAFLMYNLVFQGRMVQLAPGDVRFTRSGVEVLKPGEGWIEIDKPLEPIFYVDDDSVTQNYWSPGNLDSYNLLGKHIVADSDIECPSIVYVLLSQKTTNLYYWSKWAAYLGTRGVNTQTIVLASFGRQSKPHQKMQYCSNIALKTNTKLATLNDKACAWSWASSNKGEVDKERVWLSELPTLIVSLSTALGQGQDNKMVVVGTGYLDVEGQLCCYEARAQLKSSLIDRDVIKSIFKNLIWSFVRHSSCPPDRILVIRSGAHDGLFRDVLDKEVSAVREAFLEARPPSSLYDVCANCGNKKGCHHCCPLITYLVAQAAHHNIKLVPADNPEQGNGNVPSGTCVDSSELLLPVNTEAVENERRLREEGATDCGELLLFEGTSCGDFLLIPQGGLKGTSNGILYRVVLNENGIFGKSGSSKLTREMLQRLIYVLSFVYGKATKAPRDTALVRTGALLAQNLLGIISSMNLEERQNFLIEFNTPSGSVIFRTRDGDSLMPSFSPFRDDLLCDPFRPHVLA